MIEAALATLAERGWNVEAVSRLMTTRPVGPSRRRYANAAAVIAGTLAPEGALDDLQAIEAQFGRERRGQRWRSRVLDVDIVLWSGGAWVSRGLVIPHPLFRERSFVLGPAARIAPRWRDPLTGLTLRALDARLTRRAPLPR